MTTPGAPVLRVESFRKLAIEKPYSGVRRQSFDSARATVARYDFEPGASFPRHHHPQEQLMLVEGGTVEFTVADETRVLESQEWVIVEPNVPHGLQAGENGAHVLAILVPRRRAADLELDIRP